MVNLEKIFVVTDNTSVHQECLPTDYKDSLQILH